jgi:hypothetical protein
MKPEDIATQLKMTEEDKAAFLAVAGKYPIDTVVVDKAQFSKVKSDFDKADSLVTGWETWKAENWDKEHSMTHAQWAAVQENETLLGKVAAIEAGAYVPPIGDNMTFEEVEAQLLAKGYVKKDDVNGLVAAAKGEVASTIDGKLNMQNLSQEFFFTRASTIPMKYRDEFGSIGGFDMEAFMRHVMSGDGRFLKDPADPTGKTMVKNFDLAYEEFVAPKRLQVERANLDKEKLEVTALKTELETRKTTTPMSPTDDGRGGSVPPPFQRQIQGLDKDDVKLGGDAPFGSGSIAAQAWDLYKKGELPGVGKPN